MSKAQLLSIMGNPDGVQVYDGRNEDDSYVGITTYYFSNPSIMAGSNIISIATSSGTVVQIICSDLSVRRTVDGAEVPPEYIERWENKSRVKKSMRQ
ncbi:MAG: hypothetical protein A2516_02310 [Alphaproteobacteria bacterium RIFOXYD12_FULL_60_8]|nr:MAG: hypothetical protein A2516_02310 [Alphaproteobacteria bacterium RIFOXYD12_FULL_60_8]